MDLNRSSDDFIVLRVDGPAEGGGGQRGGETSSKALSIDKMRINANEASEVAGEANVLAAVRGCPVSLVEPVVMSGSASPGTDRGLDEDGVTWGVRSVGATTSPYSGRGVKVAVLDTGVDPAHPAFRGLPCTTKNFTDDGNDDDVVGHGTHCAATIAGQDTDGVRIGVAPAVSHLYSAKVLASRGVSNTTFVFSGFVWALEQGANIISMSLGIDFPALVGHLRMLNSDADERTVLSKAIHDYGETVKACAAIADYAKSLEHFGQTTLVVGASGNDSDRRESPASLYMAGPPAAADGVIAVGALGLKSDASPGELEAYEMAYFSNRDVSVVAPGVNVLSADVRGSLVSSSGTSMATPHVAGVAALWMEQMNRRHPNFKVEDVKARILGRCRTDGIPASASRSDIGNGLVQAPQD